MLATAWDLAIDTQLSVQNVHRTEQSGDIYKPTVRERKKSTVPNVKSSL